MKNFIFLAIFVAFFHYGHSLSCFKCNGCENTSTLKETCRNVDPETQVSGCMTQRLRTGGTADSMTIKKCAVYEKNERFDCPTLPSGETVLCQICQDDFCNAATNIKLNSWICIGILSMLAYRIFNC